MSELSQFVYITGHVKLHVKFNSERVNSLYLSEYKKKIIIIIIK